ESTRARPAPGEISTRRGDTPTAGSTRAVAVTVAAPACAAAAVGRNPAPTARPTPSPTVIQSSEPRNPVRKMPPLSRAVAAPSRHATRRVWWAGPGPDCRNCEVVATKALRVGGGVAFLDGRVFECHTLN